MQLVEVIDDFLSESQCKSLESVMLKDNVTFPWFFVDNLNYDSKSRRIKKLGNYYLSNFLFEDGEEKGVHLPLFLPILNKLSLPLSKVHKIKANLYPRTQFRVHHAPHRDYPPGENKFTCLYYINDNNGFTVFEGKKKVKSKRNRMVRFDGSNIHNSTTCTDVNARYSVNFNCMR